MKVLISVVLPVYNVEPYIKECIDSILNQTIQDFEVIVIDDCSTDSTVAVVESYNDDRISIIKKEKNKGLIDSLNLGFRLAKGKYIARVDGDDINVLNRFEKQLLFLESNPDVKACGCWLQIYDDPSKVIKHKEWHEEITAELLLKCPMSLGATMLNKEAYVHASFDKSKKHVEDYDFWARTAWGYKMHNLQEVLYYYRVHGKQVSSLYNHIQKEHDIGIKLDLFKKIQYDQVVFSDMLITKILLFDQYFKVRELALFFKWLNNLKVINKKEKVFDQVELIKVLTIIKQRLLNKIYFKKSNLGITKFWRLRALVYLNFSDWIWVLNLKREEFFKMHF
ncbi:glycosyltransferase family 2 protein [Olleya namhaensis]|uniref:glycosyltransferase family 2 protein n=1 Tax=Olleya namhaensis TaxID=1144750 RepID=UPI00232B3BF5|nr:glycosyltransferase family 2 protein [Olleya namhaensis]